MSIGHLPRVVALALAIPLAIAACDSPEILPPRTASAHGESEASPEASSSEATSSSEARSLVAAGATLLDVRSPAEFSAGHLDGAVNVPVGEVGARLAEIPRGQPVVVYCHSGARSARAASTLREAGYTVHDLGAMSAW